MDDRMKLTLKAWPIIALATIALCCVTTNLADAAGWKLHSQSSVVNILGIAGWNLRFLIVLGQVLILAPVLEEFLFRFLLWELPSPGRRTVMAVESSLLLSAAHYLTMPWPDNAFAALFFFGMAQCWLYGKTKCIWHAVLNHALFNATNLVLLLALPKEFVVS